MQQPRILYVDDDPKVIRSLKRGLDTYKVFTATSGQEGVQLLEHEPNISIVVADYRMPVMNGLTFLVLARRISPGTIRIMLTGYADFQVAVEAVNRAQIFRFLTKPVHVSELRRVLDVALVEYRQRPVQVPSRPHGTKGSVLTKREAEILTLLTNGYRRKQIAGVFRISAKTVDRHLENAKAKYGVSSVDELILFIRNGFLGDIPH